MLSPIAFCTDKTRAFDICYDVDSCDRKYYIIMFPAPLRPDVVPVPRISPLIAPHGSPHFLFRLSTEMAFSLENPDPEEPRQVVALRAEDHNLMSKSKGPVSSLE